MSDPQKGQEIIQPGGGVPGVDEVVMIMDSRFRGNDMVDNE